MQHLPQSINAHFLRTRKIVNRNFATIYAIKPKYTNAGGGGAVLKRSYVLF